MQVVTLVGSRHLPVGADEGHTGCPWPPSPALYLRGEQSTACRIAERSVLPGNPGGIAVHLWDQDTRYHLATGGRNPSPYPWRLYDTPVYRSGDIITTTAPQDANL